ncbi:MAG TPA: glucosaminidase domain-containing protein [Acidobacteriaceae bacterium]|nr:glucosaminidase domain-containing protein [Acidobacteriaceae bacterium]
MGAVHEQFLMKAAEAARSAGHLFPEFAACEAALESGWGLSHLAVDANNLFGQKQAHPALAGTETVSLPTREYLHGAWVVVQANWVKFADWTACFRERMALLHSLSAAYPNYKAALASTSGEQFLTEVSKTWSTDPGRAGKVLAIYDVHRKTLDGHSRASGRSV